MQGSFLVQSLCVLVVLSFCRLTACLVHKFPSSSRVLRTTRRQVTLQKYVEVLETDKAAALKREEADKAAAQADKAAALKREEMLQEEKKELKAMLEKAEKDRILSSAQFVGQRNLRPLVELMLRQTFPNQKLQFSEASKRVTRELFSHPYDPDSPTLKPEWAAVLRTLDTRADPRDVANELVKFYDELSKVAHYSVVRDKQGFLIGGELPLRAAVGIMILRMQQMQESNAEIPVIYCDALDNPKFELKNGQLYNIASLPLTDTDHESTSKQESE